MKTELVGTIIEIHPPQYLGDFTKQVIWVRQDGSEKPAHWEIEFWNRDIQDTARLSVGDHVKAHVWAIGKLIDLPKSQRVVNIYRCINIIKYEARN